jgi:hypothetical protein
VDDFFIITSEDAPPPEGQPVGAGMAGPPMGALMIGMSTAALMSAFQDALQKMTRTRRR